MTDSDLQDRAATRQRLLEAAGEVFADVGYQRATVREICQRAGANVAAVNYHFRDKEGLYAEVLRYAHQAAMAENVEAIQAMRSGAAMPPEQRLRIFIRTFLLRAFHPGKQCWHGKLVAREMSEPTPLLDRLVDEEIKPRAAFLEQTLREMIGNDPPQDLVRRCVRSVVAQCVFYHHCRPVVGRLHPEQGFEPGDLEVLADHITRFTLHAIAGIATDWAQQKGQTS